MLIQMPLYQRIYADLLSRIQGGEWKRGDCLPTEKDLQHLYGVSRSPIRQAMEQLEHRGYVTRQAGRGTYVSNPADRANTAWRHLTGFASHYVKDFSQVDAKLLKITEAPAPKAGIEHLGLEPGTPVLKVERLRIVVSEPVVYLSHYLSPNLGLTEKRILEFQNFRSMSVLLEQFGFVIETVHERVSAEVASATVATVLQTAVGHPLLKVHRQAFAAGERPIEFVEYFVRSDRWQYSSTFRR